MNRGRGFDASTTSKRERCKQTEDDTPQIAEEIARSVDPHAQADPRFQMPFAYTRIIAAAVREELLKNDQLKDAVPCRQTVGEPSQSPGLSASSRREDRCPKKNRETDDVFANVPHVAAPAREDDGCLRISFDSKARVSKGGAVQFGLPWLAALSPPQAVDHDRGHDRLLMPCGIREIARGQTQIDQLWLAFGTHARDE